MQAAQNLWRNEWATAGIISIERTSQPLWRKQDRCCKPNGAGCEIEPARKAGERSHFRIVNAAESVGLHHSVPDAPEENDKDNSLQVPPGKRKTDSQQENWRKNESPAKPLKQRAIAISPNHSRQVVAGGAERGHENVDVLRAPTHLRESEHRNQQQRRSDIKNQVAPTA